MALTACGVLVIGLVDNVLRPELTDQETRMPDYLVMISALAAWRCSASTALCWAR